MFLSNLDQNSQQGQSSDDTVMNSEPSIKRRNSFSTSSSSHQPPRIQGIQSQKQPNSWFYEPQSQRAANSNPSIESSPLSPIPNQNHLNFNHIHTPIRPSPLFQSAIISSSPSSSSSGSTASSSHFYNQSISAGSGLGSAGDCYLGGSGNMDMEIDGHQQKVGGNRNGSKGINGGGGKPLLKYTMGFREDCELCQKKSEYSESVKDPSV